jgi:hypothetical protein
MEVDLPGECQRYFDDFESNIWSAQKVDEFSGDYPNFLVASGQVSRSGNLATVMSDLSQKYQTLSLEDSKNDVQEQSGSRPPLENG